MSPSFLASAHRSSPALLRARSFSLVVAQHCCAVFFSPCCPSFRAQRGIRFLHSPAAGGYFHAVIPIESYAVACPGTPATPPNQPPMPVKKLSIVCADFYDPCMSGSVTGNSQPNLPAMKFQGPGGSVIGGYGGFNIFGALHCVAENDPSDPACWGVKLTLKGGMFQWSWSPDAYAAAAEKPIPYQPSPSPTGGPPVPVIPAPDPLDPSRQLIGLTLTPIPSPTARAYVCPAIQRQLAIQTGSSQQVAALLALYQKSCQCEDTRAKLSACSLKLVRPFCRFTVKLDVLASRQSQRCTNDLAPRRHSETEYQNLCFDCWRILSRFPGSGYSRPGCYPSREQRGFSSRLRCREGKTSTVAARYTEGTYGRPYRDSWFDRN
jgi:hypothetical protein